MGDIPVLIHVPHSLRKHALISFTVENKPQTPHHVIFVSFQRDAAVSSLYFISLQDLSTCFGCSLHPSSGVLKTAYATTGASHVMWQVSSVMR
jgi:hypothetical protein